MKLKENLTLGMPEKELMMYSGLVENGRLVDGESGGHYQVLFCGDAAIKCPYDGCESEHDEHAVRLMRESVVQKDLEVNGLNVPEWLGYYSGGDGRRPIIVMKTIKISPAGKRLMSKYLEGMERIRELGYVVEDTRFNTNHGADKNGESILYDFGGYTHEDWKN